MAKRHLCQIAALLLAAPPLYGQSPSPVSPADAVDPACATPVCPECSVTSAALPPHIWVGADYLLWWIKPGPLATPLVTVSTDNLQSGNLGQPGTAVLFGQQRLDYGAFNGLRAGIGGWIDPDCLLGLEANGLVLEQRSVRWSALSNSAGIPLLALPYRTPLGAETSYTVTTPAVPGIPAQLGGVAISSTSNLDGAEANGTVNVLRRGAISTDLLAGVRYLSLDEDLQVGTSSTMSLGPLGNLATATSDRFDTQNRFAGGQIGSRLGYSAGWLSLDLLGQVALGATHQVVNVSGNSTSTSSGALAGLFPASAEGGVFTEPCSIGRLTHDEFTVVPEMQLRLGIGILPGIKTFVGYNFLYWSSVVRPGDQIDRTINPSQSFLLGGTGLLSGSARPSGPFGQTDMWAQGLSLDVELGW
jgi:Putative beta barrel porin-7 (BBP7)